MDFLLLSVYLTHIIRFATANRASPDFCYYVSSNILRIFVVKNHLKPSDEKINLAFCRADSIGTLGCGRTGRSVAFGLIAKSENQGNLDV